MVTPSQLSDLNSYSTSRAKRLSESIDETEQLLALVILEMRGDADRHQKAMITRWLRNKFGDEVIGRE